MKKKPRNTLSDLLQEVDIENLKEAKISPKQVKPIQPKKQGQQNKSTPKVEPPAQTILDKIKEEEIEKRTRITIDLDPETYAELKQLVDYTGKTQAKLIRALIKETTKLLQKMQ
ncbi:ribbon-helix-helix protein, CopG family [Hassallia byssoidea VB512170]|uniref:Ribbon-helix-helix protein, CopG family n=1 Tax=Hassallia byssoidea VB512170 TaxID=1304833 RepID=A0A846HGS0_9CYAN|nr:ribbon-helix-helix protein, CopG family [Hassalia byssoidea]NEU76697.1 ribbon-helix-helix protein, CopG family [Hassalia byssoidea VB512170]